MSQISAYGITNRYGGSSMGSELTKGNCLTHQISLKSRESMEVSGVTDVISFDEQSVVLSTICGNMEIDGNALHIHVLSMEQGVVTMDGRIDSVTYYDQETDEKDGRRGFFGKILR